MKKLISVIVPIYKVEKYLNRCIESIVHQTYSNLEIILVDDGSPDNCPIICDKWKDKDSRIKVIHKKNGGLSDARNAGLAIVTGEYVAFVDSDDWIHRNMLENMVQCINENDADIVECKSQMVADTVEDLLFSYEAIEQQIFQGESVVYSLICESPLKQTVWNKLYKKEVIDSIEFAVGKYHEDEFWTYQIFDRAKKVVYFNAEMYYYFQRNESIMGEQFSLKRLDALEGRYNRLKLIRKKYSSLIFIAEKNLFFLIVYFGQKALKTLDKENQKIYFLQVSQYLNDFEILYTKRKKLSFSNRLWVCLGKKKLRLLCNIRNKFGIGKE